MEKPSVRIAGTRYLVELDGQDHYVSSRRCSCGRACQAVRLVAEYLANGGRPAPAGHRSTCDRSRLEMSSDQR